MDETTPFEVNIGEQPEALRRFATRCVGIDEGMVGKAWDRIVLTGMGSSHFAGIPTWRALVARGHAAWSIDTGQLLDSPQILTPRTLVVITSQSGASGEVVELLERRRSGRIRAGGVIGITDDEAGPLARAADVFVPIHSGPEATVSTKSYLNSLAAHQLLLTALDRAEIGALRDELFIAADAVQATIGETDADRLTSRIMQLPERRLATVGWDDYAATALFAGLIIKESAKVAIEGFVGGQFRHGPMELAGPGLGAILFGAHPGATSVERLARDLAGTGSTLVVVGTRVGPGEAILRAAAPSPVIGLMTSAVVAEKLAVGIARANGVVPGKFAFGSKVTTAL